jgi:hypothetical protein
MEHDYSAREAAIFCSKTTEGAERLRGCLQPGKVAVQFRVATGTVQRIAAAG